MINQSKNPKKGETLQVSHASTTTTQKTKSCSCAKKTPVKKEKLNPGILNEMFQNAHIALQSINDLLPEVEDLSIKNELYYQQDLYDDFISRLSEFMDDNSVIRKDVSGMKKAMLWSAIKMKTLTGASNNKVADMMIKGATSGINELMRIKNHNDLHPTASLFLDELLKIENNSVESLKNYL